MAGLSRYVAPAGAPIAGRDLLRWAATAVASGRAGDRLCDALGARFGARSYVLTSTGRAGMTLLLQAMRRIAPADRDEVVVPSYTCYSVAASAVKAGLKVRLVDIDPATLDFAADALQRTDFRRVLAIVATNLYGLPNDMPALASIARAEGVFLIDDAAQAMGARVAGRPSGTWGDAGLFSFDKGKNVCAIDGGVLLTDSAELSAAIDAEVAALPGPSAVERALHVAKALAYFAMLRPAAYGIATRLPGLRLGETVFTTDFPLHRPDPRLSALASTMLGQLETFTAARQANAGAWLSALAGRPGVETIRAVDRATPVYLRLPVLLDSEAARSAAITALNASGIGATRSYPASLVDVPALAPALVGPLPPMAGGRHVAARILTLPTHPFVELGDIARAAAVLGSAIIGARPARPAAFATPRAAASAGVERLGENH